MIVVSNTTPLIGLATIGGLTVIRPELEQLRQHGFGISQSVVDTVLEQAGEQ